MGNGLTTVETKLPTQFKPEEAKTNIAKADAIIEMAARLNDWPLLEEAIDYKIEEQKRFVGWWQDNVQRPGGSR